jgi:hypothetical protein
VDPATTALPGHQDAEQDDADGTPQIALAINPPLAAQDHGVIGTIRWTPGGVT